jgi:hypothetical protein
MIAGNVLTARQMPNPEVIVSRHSRNLNYFSYFLSNANWPCIQAFQHCMASMKPFCEIQRFQPVRTASRMAPS